MSITIIIIVTEDDLVTVEQRQLLRVKLQEVLRTY